MSRPRILIVSFSRLASDARVLKQIRHFAVDFDVTTCGYGPSPQDGVRHLALEDANGFRRWSRKDILLRRYSKIYQAQPAVLQAGRLARSEPRFDVILANDIDTVGLAVDLAPRYGVHADIHEYAPRQNEELALWRALVKPYITWMCRNHLPRVTSMTTVGAGLAAEYSRRFGLNPGVVTNAAPFADLDPTSVGSPIRLVHSGAALANRQVETMISAVEATSSDVTLDLYLVPNDPAYVKHLRTVTAASRRVRVLEPVPYDQLVETLNRYDVGIHIIPPTNFNNRWSLPNKFFDYVQARLAVLIGPSPEMARRLTDHDFGVIAEGFDAASVTRALDSLTRERVERLKFNSAVAAPELASESQVAVWDRYVRGILSSHAS